jgi:hypothetical protein
MEVVRLTEDETQADTMGWLEAWLEERRREFFLFYLLLSCLSQTSWSDYFSWIPDLRGRNTPARIVIRIPTDSADSK